MLGAISGAALFCIPVARAQVMEAPPCPEVSVRAPNEIWYPPSPDPTLFRDRRPASVISLRNGQTDNPRGLGWAWWLQANTCTDQPSDNYTQMFGNGTHTGGPNGRPDVFDYLLGDLQAQYDAGFRRMVLVLPAGSVHCETFPSSQWLTLATWRRQWFLADTINGKDGVHGWLSRTQEPVQLALYTGWRISDPASICYETNAFSTCQFVQALQCGPDVINNVWMWPCANAGTPLTPLTENSIHMCTVWRNTQGWADVGVRRVWLDAASVDSSEDPLMFRNYAYNPDYRSQGVSFGGEAFPIVPPWPQTGRVTIRWDEFNYAPFAITLAWAEFGQNNGDWCPPSLPGAHTWAPPPGTEAPVLPTYMPTCENDPTTVKPDWVPGKRLDSMYNFYICKGFTVWEYGFEFAQRFFGFGWLEQPADFNGDGVVNSDDMSRYLRFYQYSSGYNGPGVLTYYHGDLNGDHVVNNADLNLFLDWYNNPGPRWLGPLTWDPNANWFPPCGTWNPPPPTEVTPIDPGDGG